MQKRKQSLENGCVGHLCAARNNRKYLEAALSMASWRAAIISEIGAIVSHENRNYRKYIYLAR